MRRRKRIRQFFESGVACAAGLLVPLLPRRLVVMLARVLGVLAFRLNRRDRRTAEANLRIAFGDSLDESRRDAIILGSFHTFALLLLDLFWFSRHTAKRVAAHFRTDETWAYYAETTPLIAVTGHLGNWELLGLATAAAGYPLTSVAMPLQNARADAMVNRAREATGMRVVPRRGAVRALLKELRRGGRVALLMDQNTLPEEGGAFRPFFGLPAPVSEAVGGLWQRTHAKVLFGWCIPDASGVYHAHAEPPFPDSPNTSAADVTAQLVACQEETIRRFPEHWLWSYRRWRYVPEGEDASQYPFYAIPYINTKKEGVT